MATPTLAGFKVPVAANEPTVRFWLSDLFLFLALLVFFAQVCVFDSF